MRKRGHSIHRDGPGRIRIKLAELITQLCNCECDPYDIWQNNYPAAKYMDLARWGVDCRFPDGVLRNVHSWDTMTECVKKGLAIVSEDDWQVCSK